MCFTDTEFLTLPIRMLHQIKNSYYECYQQIFCYSNQRYWRTKKLKEKARDYCKAALANHCHKQKFQFKPLLLHEVDNI